MDILPWRSPGEVDFSFCRARYGHGDSLFQLVAVGMEDSKTWLSAEVLPTAVRDRVIGNIMPMLELRNVHVAIAVRRAAHSLRF